jgi:hypothetical protein
VTGWQGYGVIRKEKIIEILDAKKFYEVLGWRHWKGKSLVV